MARAGVWGGVCARRFALNYRLPFSVINKPIVADSIEKYRILDAHNDRVAPPIWRPLSRLNSDGFNTSITRSKDTIYI